ncbi:guanine nucleotide exchange factor MSS4 homolog [Pieris rapae]|uniref:guanine nucleotide exchange factor MSS4 homolog n=1 Tax=Pieris rapae TaxID=64459 RepID=UPI001E27CABB|nr:guanine nucleotide exchange factor MSS4 homolog [Pieris rapae]XP_045488484.1 guanine nucleotide exchange factor MSS4 homolog [Pieris rapae]XP_045488485.1 guanine nucleotide exchange factor MSS4 homolog [Pieris rapae]
MSDADTKDAVENEYVEDESNKLLIKCKFCGSKILERKSGKFVIKEIDLPLMEQDKRAEAKVQYEKINQFFFVENMYTFENIGFTHTIDNCKYLSCADCDAGPVGYYNMDTKHSYVALSRVKHE